MNINWVLANDTLFHADTDVQALKNIGPFWGSWQTWRNCQTDNVICYDLASADRLIKKEFQKLCNLYLTESVYQQLDQPRGVKLYGGTPDLDLDNQEEIIAMHLAAAQSDLVLLMGFDWLERPKLQDRLLEHRAHCYRSLVKQVIKENATVQWVLIDHAPGKLMPELKDLENLSQDSLTSVLGLLGS